MFLKVVFQILYTLLIFIESLLSIRFILKLIGASASVPLVNWIYSATNVILSPVRGIVIDSISFWGITIEISTLLMLFFLTLIAYGFYEIIKALK